MQLQKNKLKNILLVKTKTPIDLITLTKEHKLRKKNEFGENPYWNNCLKLSKIHGIINFSYQDEVNKQRLKEGITEFFEPLERKWGQRIFGTPFVEHKEKIYLEVMILNQESKYKTLTGEEISAGDIEPFLTTTKETRQGVKNTVILRDFSLDSILKVRLNNKEYTIC